MEDFQKSVPPFAARPRRRRVRFEVKRFIVPPSRRRRRICSVAPTPRRRNSSPGSRRRARRIGGVGGLQGGFTPQKCGRRDTPTFIFSCSAPSGRGLPLMNVTPHRTRRHRSRHLHVRVGARQKGGGALMRSASGESLPGNAVCLWCFKRL